MHENLNVALIQSDLIWENPDQNLANFSKKINAIDNAIDLIILPEMFSTGFTMHPEKVVETMQGDTVAWMKEMASNKKVAITGSMVIQENGKYYNRLVFVHPDGVIETYDKRHTFTLAGEDLIYASGDKKLFIQYKGWKICPLICYDLRFPVWSRNVEGYDLLIYVANWPKPRIVAWNALLKARAIENMSFCIGVNRVGIDANNYEYSGHSAVYDVLGTRISTINPAEEGLETIALSKSHIKKYREKLQFLNDRDDFTLSF
ncbi:MAG: amidohydrolase [Flavobacteriaceae bacterium]|nr:amidohydrolase [Flavobacteriaceae bacterium]